MPWTSTPPMWWREVRSPAAPSTRAVVPVVTARVRRRSSLAGASRKGDLAGPACSRLTGVLGEALKTSSFALPMRKGDDLRQQRSAFEREKICQTRDHLLDGVASRTARRDAGANAHAADLLGDGGEAASNQSN